MLGFGSAIRSRFALNSTQPEQTFREIAMITVPLIQWVRGKNLSHVLIYIAFQLIILKFMIETL